MVRQQSKRRARRSRTAAGPFTSTEAMRGKPTRYSLDVKKGYHKKASEKINDGEKGKKIGKEHTEKNEL